MAALEPGAPGLAPQDSRLLQLARGGLPLSNEPFADIGRPLGVGGDVVIERLRGLLGRGVISRVGPIFATIVDWSAADPWERELRDATASGLPLVRQPFEAVGAQLGVPAERVRTQLAAWLADGRMLRIAAVAEPDVALPPGR
jgi:DNA-binding Lrp family transcriptional regulator